MFKKTASLFLLFLFGLVILFPGYNQYKSKKKTIFCKMNVEVSLLSVLKKCLSSGIANISAEEENRSSSAEEETALSAGDAQSFLLQSLLQPYPECLGRVSFRDKVSLYRIQKDDIISPPPNPFLS